LKVFSSKFKNTKQKYRLFTGGIAILKIKFVNELVRGGFEPPKASPTDLQSVPFGRSGTSPLMSWREELNPQQADYKSAALPIELRQQSI
jgi:hypothetical protein